ncbi:hypothetical protein PsYK624_147370 [Phanerochaete sordida]|uniref:Rhodanese domain-containing protein n=1 Tax=Phanerochaete sordida TaxID=48140 RepID=A0A9P3GS70_9APHY|nr:hypothetical protein PsYK624_147370 [Phanerochaete sordida]
MEQAYEKSYGRRAKAKGEYDLAMQHFLPTIGFLQLSYVIRKELRRRGLANANHTILLSNTYTKLQDVADELPFDRDTTVPICCQAGYYEHAAYLAKKHGHHKDSLRHWVQSVPGTEGAPASVEPDPNADPELKKQDQAAVWNTFLELYLVNTPVQRAELPDDHTHTIFLCSTRTFTPKLVLLWEMRGMAEDVLCFHMTASARSPAAARRRTPCTASTKEKIMPLLAVIQMLNRNSVASVEHVKQWLLARITAVHTELDMDKKLIESYHTESAAKLRQVTDLSYAAHSRVFRVTQCAVCCGHQCVCAPLLLECTRYHIED